jgi:hypothetical protein
MIAVLTAAGYSHTSADGRMSSSHPLVHPHRPGPVPDHRHHHPRRITPGHPHSRRGPWIDFTVLTRTDRAITEGILTTARAPFLTVHAIGLQADDLITDDDRYQAALIAAIGATWTPDADAHRGHTPGRSPEPADPEPHGAGTTGASRSIDLRHQENQSGTTEPTGREYTHRWYVRGHWRQQPHGPAHALRRPTWIPGHTKRPRRGTPSRRGTRPRLAALTRGPDEV